MKKRIAAVTMVYNEASKLPRWVTHYSAHVHGLAHLHVIDHASTDGSTAALSSLNLSRCGRGQPMTQSWRAEYVSAYCNNLLTSYEYVLYSDADELIVPDPFRFRTLYEYVSTERPDSQTTIGFDVLHDASTEPRIDDRYVLEQRCNLQFVSAVCKPALINSFTEWVPGFHYSNHAPRFGDLFLFHLRYADLYDGLERLKITRALERPDMKDVAIDHQKISDDTYSKWISSWVQLPLVEGPIDMSSPEISKYVNDFKFRKNDKGIYGFDYSFRSKCRYHVPENFRYVA